MMWHLRAFAPDSTTTMIPLRTISLAFAPAPVLVLALALVGSSLGACSTNAQSTSSPARSARGQPFATTVVGGGVMTSRGATGSRGVVVGLRSREALTEFDAAMRDEGLAAIAERLGGLPEFDPEQEVLVFVEFPDRSGSELRSVVDGLERDADLVHVIAHLEFDPTGSMTDDLNRTWVLVRAPAAALAGDPTLTLELDPEPRESAR